MKKAWIALALLAALLPGCAAAPASSSGVEPESEAVQQEAMAEQIQQEADAAEAARLAEEEAARQGYVETGELRLVGWQSYVDTHMLPMDGGLLVPLEELDEAASRKHKMIVSQWGFWYLDVENRQMTRLGAMSFEPEGEDSTFLGMFYRSPRPFRAGDDFYYVDHNALYRMDIEAGTREAVYRLASLEGEQEYRQEWGWDPWYTDGTYFYTAISTVIPNESYGEDRTLVRISLATGEMEPIYEFESGYEFVNGWSGRDLLIKQKLFPTDPNDFYDEYGNYDHEAAAENEKKAIFQIRAVNLDTGNMRVLYNGEVGSGHFVFLTYGENSRWEDILTCYITNQGWLEDEYIPGELYLYNAKQDAWGLAFATEGEECHLYFYDEDFGMLVGEPDLDTQVFVFPGYETVARKYWRLGADGGGQPEEWRLLDPSLPEGDANFAPVIPVAEYGEYYIVPVNWIEDIYVIGADGAAFLSMEYNPYFMEPSDWPEDDRPTGSISRYQYALILKEDYWNSKANYLPITITEG